MPENVRLPGNIPGSFTCRKSTWDKRLYFPFEGRRAEDFFGLKNPTTSAGFEPANLGTKCQHATSRPPKPLKSYDSVEEMEAIPRRGGGGMISGSRSNVACLTYTFLCVTGVQFVDPTAPSPNDSRNVRFACLGFSCTLNPAPLSATFAYNTSFCHLTNSHIFKLSAVSQSLCSSNTTPNEDA